MTKVSDLRPRSALRSRPHLRYPDRLLRTAFGVCRHCKLQFSWETRQPYRLREFCSLRCAGLHRSHFTQCVVCGASCRFYPSAPRTYCSNACYDAAKREALHNPRARCRKPHLRRLPSLRDHKKWLYYGAAKWARERRTRTVCAHCRHVFYPQKHRARKFCSTRCYFHYRTIGFTAPQECLLHCRYPKGLGKSKSSIMNLPPSLRYHGLQPRRSSPREAKGAQETQAC
jgi:hypothetical protein